MAREYHSIDLTRLSLSPGEGRKLGLDSVSGVLELGGQSYEFDSPAKSATLDVSRTATGYAMRLRFSAELSGPCMRCLADASGMVEVDAREVDQPSSDDEELRSPYVTDEELDLASWARDALALALPSQILCRADCPGLCPVCGVSLSEVDPAEHRHESEGDPRWAKLRELELD
jgi:uncharacterized protein